MNRLELQIAVDAGMSIAQLAERFGCSKGSVRYGLAKYGMKTTNRSPRNASPEVAAARAAGQARFLGICDKHGETEFILRADGGARCKRCRTAMVIERLRRVKEILVEEAGDQCALCGYHRYNGALAFHHLDPATKVTALAAKGRALSIERLRAEAQKCVLLCHNCHAEVEAGLVTVPVHWSRRTASL